MPPVHLSDVNRAREGRGPENLVRHPSQFERYFQAMELCADCRQPRAFVTQPTAGISAILDQTRTDRSVLLCLPRSSRKGDSQWKKEFEKLAIVKCRELAKECPERAQYFTEPADFIEARLGGPVETTTDS